MEGEAIIPVSEKLYWILLFYNLPFYFNLLFLDLS